SVTLLPVASTTNSAAIPRSSPAWFTPWLAPPAKLSTFRNIARPAPKPKPPKMKEALGVSLQHFFESGKVEAGQEFADFQCANLLSGHVDLAIVIFAEKIEVELNLSGSVLAP